MKNKNIIYMLLVIFYGISSSNQSRAQTKLGFAKVPFTSKDELVTTFKNASAEEKTNANYRDSKLTWSARKMMTDFASNNDAYKLPSLNGTTSMSGFLAEAQEIYLTQAEINQATVSRIEINGKDTTIGTFSGTKRGVHNPKEPFLARYDAVTDEWCLLCSVWCANTVKLRTKANRKGVAPVINATAPTVPSSSGPVWSYTTPSGGGPITINMYGGSNTATATSTTPESGYSMNRPDGGAQITGAIPLTQPVQYATPQQAPMIQPMYRDNTDLVILGFANLALNGLQTFLLYDIYRNQRTGQVVAVPNTTYNNTYNNTINSNNTTWTNTQTWNNWQHPHVAIPSTVVNPWNPANPSTGDPDPFQPVNVTTGELRTISGGSTGNTGLITSGGGSQFRTSGGSGFTLNGPR